MSTKLNVTHASDYVGVTPKTFRKHVEKKNISFQLNDKGYREFEVSELHRAYGSNWNYNIPDNPAAKDAEQGSNSPASLPNNSPQLLDTNTAVEIAILKEKLTQAEKQRDYFQEEYKEEKSKRENSIKLLEDHTSKQDQWGKMFQELQKQREEDKEALNELKAFKADMLRRQKAARQRRLEQQHNKPLWQKIFAGEKKK